jgi:peptide/nickel transport system ATP-binding protein
LALLEVKELRVYFHTQDEIVRAVDDVSFTLDKAKTLGLAGESGCGKTTLGLSLARILPATAKVETGQVILDGFDVLSASQDELREIRWKRIAVVLQAAMNALNPIMKIEDQIAEALVIHDRIEKREAVQKARSLLERVGIDQNRGKEYPHQFSGGMKQRAMIAMALTCKPSVLIADEPTTALDVIVQAQILELLSQLRKEEDLSIILISHDLGVISKLCDYVGIMYAGKLVEFGRREQMLNSPRHPYTKGLIECVPRLRGEQRDLISLPGDPPKLVNIPPGCRFRFRCRFARKECEIDPPTIEVEPEHQVSCILYR